MSNSSQQYVFGLRWETRCLIAFIVLTFVGIVTMIYADTFASSLVLGSLTVVGIAIAITLRQLLREDYLHTTPTSTIVALIPPISMATVYVGMISSWMQRVGFGTFMRVAVTSLLLWSVVAVALPLTTFESTLVLLTSAATSILRQITGPSRYLLPWTLGLLCLMMLRTLPT